ncbi:cytochrome P450 [Trametes elegans]|nr:cytochrome P450 [Trametes elegans]
MYHCYHHAIRWRIAQCFFSSASQDGTHLFFGHERTVYSNQPGHAFRRWTNTHGLTYRIKAAFGLVLNDPTGIAYILQKKIYDYHHSHVVRPRVARLLGKGLGWVEGEAEHKRMRHLVSPSLSSENVKRMSGDIRLGALQVIDDLTAHIQSRKVPGTVNILDWLAKATLNIIGRVAFLHDFEGGKSQQAQQILNSRRRAVSQAAQYASFFTLMLLRRFPVLNELPIPALQAQGLAKMAIHSGVARELVKRHDNQKNTGDGHVRQDLLSKLLVAHDSNELSKEELCEQVWKISGHETTTQTLGFTVFELSRHSEVQKKLREELRCFPHEPTYDDYQTQLPYLDAVLKETSSPSSSCLPDRCGLRRTRLHVQVVIIPAIAIHRMDAVWKDPDAFRPERWMEDMPPLNDLCSGWAHTLAFSDGPRNCVGLRLAVFQYKVILHYLTERFRFGDAQVEISLKIASSLQAWVVGQPGLGPAFPVRVELL